MKIYLIIASLFLLYSIDGAGQNGNRKWLANPGDLRNNILIHYWTENGFKLIDELEIDKTTYLKFQIAN